MLIVRMVVIWLYRTDNHRLIDLDNGRSARAIPNKERYMQTNTTTFCHSTNDCKMLQAFLKI